MMLEPMVLRLYDAGVQAVDAGVRLVADAGAGPVVLPSPETDLGGFMASVFAAFNDRNWRYLAALTVIGSVFLIRWLLAKKLPKLQEGKWAWTLAVGGTACAALAAHLGSDRPLGGIGGILSALLSGGFVGLAGAGAVKGVYEWAGRSNPPPTTAPVVAPSVELPLPAPPDESYTPPQAARTGPGSNIPRATAVEPPPPPPKDTKK